MKRYAGLLLTASLAVLASGMAQAQTMSSETSGSGAQDAPVSVPDIVVTGSRVITNGNNSPTPVTVVSVDQLQATRPSTIFESLLDMPAFGGSRGGLGAPSRSSAGGNNSQINALNLRGLGPVRTLILYDGHRVPPTQQDGLVDANTIPQMLLQRVDIVTGGASAVYGSDAIGGVVNFVTDRAFNGVKLEAQSGISEQGDAPTWRLGAAWGTDLFGGRGHFEASVQNIHDSGILKRSDRGGVFDDRYTIQGLGTAASPYYLVAGATNSTFTFGGKINGPATNPLRNMHFTDGGVLVPFVNGQVVSSTIQIGGDGGYDTSSSIKPSSDLKQAFGRFDFDVTDDVHFFVQSSYTKLHGFNYFGNANIQNVTISSTNAFLAPEYQQALAAAGIKSFTFSKKYWEPVASNDFYTKSFYLNAGLEGDLGQFKWEGSYTRSFTEFEARGNFTFHNGRTYAALDAVRDPATGNIVCSVTLTNPGLYPGCVPMNVFGPGSESDEALAYASQQGITVSKMPTDDFSGSISGPLFDLWAGPVTVAVSGEYRKQGFSLTSTNLPVNAAPLDCTGLRFNCTPASATSVGTPQFNGSTAERPFVSQTVKEAAIEADIPLLRDFVLARSLNLNLAYRHARYSSTGSPDTSAANQTNRFKANTWKAGLDWHVTDSLTVRATRSRDFRAPNLYELYQPNAIRYTNAFTDILTGRNVTPTGALVPVVTGGNVNLRPEKGDTMTLGVVFKPSARFSISVDAFDIKVRDFITSINGYDASIQRGCYDGNAFYCSLQQRPSPISDTSAANSVTTWYSQPFNIAKLKTRGVDVEVNYRTTLFNRNFSLRGLMTYQPHVRFYQPGATTLDYAGAYGVPEASGAAGPRTRITLYAHYDVTDAFSIDWQTRWRDKMRLSPDPTIVAGKSTDLKAIAYSNLTLTAKLGGPFDGESAIYFNVQNVFDQKAPIAASYANSGQPGLFGGFAAGDDPIGRYYTIGVRTKF